MSHKKQLKEVGLWIGKRFASGAIFATGIAALVAGAYAFQTLTSNPSTAGFTSGGAPMLTRSGGTFDRETMSLEAISDFVTTLSIVTPVNGSQLGYNGGANATSVQLTWNSVPKAVGYTVYMGTSQGSLSQQGTSQSGTTITVNTSKNTTYYWKVQASMPAPYKPKESVISSFITNCPATETLDGGSTCIGTKVSTTVCAPPNDATKYFSSAGGSYAFANGSTSYQPNITWNGSNWSAIPATGINPVTTPSSGTCDWRIVCPSGYTYNTTINKCEITAFNENILLGTDYYGVGNAWYKCPTNTYVTSFSAAHYNNGSHYYNYNYGIGISSYSGNTRSAFIGSSACTAHNIYYSSPSSYNPSVYTNTNTSIDGMQVSGGSVANSCYTDWFSNVGGGERMSQASPGGKKYYYYNPWWLGDIDNATSYSGYNYRGWTITMKCALK